ncbi:5-formyltetrahydrofolate cyclo-ligase [Latilactobacillus sakei]|uniref:5-formyltetrahydrofolate cyclo-ligase n=1 Tax=Latilactobacillus sakei TaxID=1599 RepID=UPI00077C1549|nr:5-formyltetrahydrofolate cyclo-ligase [Latilactobacillus sakei]AWZ41831.1 5-formyltetrahydrofolate cyclo-ligase [Latilactobacillus sakei]AWZ44541.1 5-formyltetrahydrofolate cyclo-ligase [Latilactobacillus sakei]AYG17018.1 5-formyltetrahydrofolate cyclo-ligase [Latilactobacillus sakei]AYG25739.1 5-formyltetrahydrofolate cyclo-ligase [Latilactobacillus sakei]AYG29882.1 5-formyltetrahydrofolate cyclo-ligase [Latilactobacillus sakei]
MQTKQQVRQQGLAALQRLAQQPANKQQQEAILLQKLIDSAAFQSATVIGMTLNQPIEVATQPIIEAAQAAGKRIVVPRTLPKRQMAFYELTPTTVLERSHFDVLEPQITGEPIVPDLMIVPGVVFSLDGWRVGFGGGYYDRYLAAHHMNTVALALKPQQVKVPDWSVDQFDVKLKHIITA